MSFGGTATLDNATFAALMESVVRSVLRHGFGIRRIHWPKPTQRRICPTLSAAALTGGAPSVAGRLPE
jgi:hypothetical protein